jgi:outer membrane protein OmpA-like peptidoglycan-associated protein
MRYDVFLVNALADSEQAELLVRRLRALKFKVRHDKKREHTTPTPKDYRDADNSQSIMVLWSKASCDTSKKDSDWVHAIAHHARSKDNVLVQVGLDKTVPDEPFDKDKRYALAGLTSRKTVDGYYDLVDDLGKRDGRKNLRAWIDMKTSDKDGKEAWKKKHPTDPLSLVGQPKPKAAPKVAAATAAGGAAAFAGAMATTKAPEASAIAAKPAPAPTASYTEDDDEGSAWWLLAWVIAGILAMLIFAWWMRSKPLPAVAVSCPVIETGPIVDDTIPPTPVKLSTADLRSKLTAKLQGLGFEWLGLNINGNVPTLTGTAPNAGQKRDAFEAGRAVILTDDDAAGRFNFVVDGINVEGGEAGIGAALADLGSDTSLEACQKAFTDTMSGRNIEFGTGAANITNRSGRLLNVLSGAAILCNDHDIEVQGHADATGNPDANLALSQSRAEAVVAYLADKGVDTTKITAKGYGSTQLLDTSNTPEANARNRRTEFVLSN